MSGENRCRYCGRAIRMNPYLGDTNPEHIREIANEITPSLELLHAEDREYDTFCSKEHYVQWVKDERHRLPPEPTEEEGTDERHGPSL